LHAIVLHRILLQPKLWIIQLRRQVKRNKSVIQLLLFGDETTEDDIKSKNIRQTEILVDLREAVLQVGRHFMALDPKLSRLSLQVKTK
jgi:small G protein signaling modulator 3